MEACVLLMYLQTASSTKGRRCVMATRFILASKVYHPSLAGGFELRRGLVNPVFPLC